MSDNMKPISFEKLIYESLSEYRRNQKIYGVAVNRGGFENSCSPLGAAAGPHTQLAQNIAAAYAAGASWFELKTVQVLSGKELGIGKPCIYVGYEAYNIEWSSELAIEDAALEYIKAFLLLHVLAKELHPEYESPTEAAKTFRFIISVGYDYQGITSKRVDAFLEVLKDAAGHPGWEQAIEFLKDNEAFTQIDESYLRQIPTQIADTVTLSTMHGCPAGEIERIAWYLLGKKKLNTYVKLNPALLGAEKIKEIFRELQCSELAFEEESFAQDISFEAAVDMIKRLHYTAQSLGLKFGVKLTNTFPVKIRNQELAGENMYMSGPLLYPCAIGVAAKLAEALQGEIEISYSGGADKNNIADILGTGIYPVTIATLLLKPGGYHHFTVLNKMLSGRQDYGERGICVEALKELSGKAVSAGQYVKKEVKRFAPKENYSSLCAACNNCVEVCPNRANRFLETKGQSTVIHLDDLCNECGNCANFCVMGHRPYLEKLTVFSDKEMFDNSENDGFYREEEQVIYRKNGVICEPEQEIQQMIKAYRQVEEGEKENGF